MSSTKTITPANVTTERTKFSPPGRNRNKKRLNSLEEVRREEAKRSKSDSAPQTEDTVSNTGRNEEVASESVRSEIVDETGIAKEVEQEVNASNEDVQEESKVDPLSRLSTHINRSDSVSIIKAKVNAVAKHTTSTERDFTSLLVKSAPTGGDVFAGLALVSKDQAEIREELGMLAKEISFRGGRTQRNLDDILTGRFDLSHISRLTDDQLSQLGPFDLAGQIINMVERATQFIENDNWTESQTVDEFVKKVLVEALDPDVRHVFTYAPNGGRCLIRITDEIKSGLSKLLFTVHGVDWCDPNTKEIRRALTNAPKDFIKTLLNNRRKSFNSAHALMARGVYLGNKPVSPSELSAAAYRKAENMEYDHALDQYID